MKRARIWQTGTALRWNAKTQSTNPPAHLPAFELLDIDARRSVKRLFRFFGKIMFGNFRVTLKMRFQGFKTLLRLIFPRRIKGR